MTEHGMSAEAGAEDHDVTIEDLHRAAEEARQTETEKPSAEDLSHEDDAENQPSEGDLESEEEPKDNATRTKLGMKVAAQEKLIADLSSKLDKSASQLEQVTNYIVQFAQAARQQQEPEEDDYIPTDTKGFLEFLDKVQTRRATQSQQAAQQFANQYVKVVDGLGQSETDPALVAEIKKLTTEPGQPFNKKYSSDPVADATANFYRAKAHVLEQRIPKPKENPFKGGDPKTPLGAAPSSSVKSQTKGVDIDQYARRAAAAWGYSGKEIEDMLKQG